MDRKKVTIREVAERAGVSVSTAGRVIGNYGYISDEKRKKVEDAIRELSYTPNAAAQGLRSSHMKTIGIVLGDIKNHFFSRLFSSMERVARANGYITIVCVTNDSVALEVESLRLLYNKRVDGIVLVSSYKIGEKIQPSNSYLYNGDIPVIYVDRKVEGALGSVVAIDNWRGGYDGMNYLIGLGCREIGIVAPPEFITVEKRIAGCRAALEEHRFPFQQKNLLRFSGDRRLLDQWLDTHGNLDAFFLLNSDSIGNLLLALRQKNRLLRRDFSLITWDDCELAQYTNSTIMEQPVEQMGIVAVQQLLEKIKDRDKVIHDVDLKAQLFQRDG